MDKELTNFKSEPMASISKSRHNIKLHAGFASLYPYMSAALRAHQRSFFVQWMAVNAETHTWSGAENKPQMGHLYPPHLYKVQRPLCKKRQKDYKSQRSGKTGMK